MVSSGHVSASDDSSDEIDLLRTPKKMENTQELSMRTSGLSHRFRSPHPPSKQRPQKLLAEEPPRPRASTSEEKRIAVLVQGPARPWEYLPFATDNTVDVVLAQIDQPDGQLLYRIEYEDGRREDVSVGTFFYLRDILCRLSCELGSLKQSFDIA